MHNFPLFTIHSRVIWVWRPFWRPFEYNCFSMIDSCLIMIMHNIWNTFTKFCALSRLLTNVQLTTKWTAAILDLGKNRIPSPAPVLIIIMHYIWSLCAKFHAWVHLVTIFTIPYWTMLSKKIRNSPIVLAATY